MKDVLSNKSKPEYILCAAIWFKDGVHYKHQPKNIDTGFVVCGRRHHNCFMISYIFLSEKHNIIKRDAVQGFLTSNDRFVDRKEAGKIAFEQKQIIELTDCLFSEDLY